jgi:hypothetical protein
MTTLISLVAASFVSPPMVVRTIFMYPKKIFKLRLKPIFPMPISVALRLI